jgi:ribosome recycling factor
MIIADIELKMKNSIDHFEKELSSLRTSRASISMLDNLMIDVYGSTTPISQLGNISVSDASTLTIQVWDNSIVKKIENTILDSNLGINPQVDGTLIRLPVPKLSEERRLELSKIASQYSENAKIAVRNNRREYLDIIKQQEKDKEISQDELKKISTDVQKITDKYIDFIEKIVTKKKIEITTV